MHDDLYMIKKKYGENMMHLCQELFPTILETNGSLYQLLSDNFAYSKFLYNDIIGNNLKESFKNYIYSLFKGEETYVESEKSVEELLDEAEYKFYECHSNADIQSFKKYYKEKEQLCTFNNNRLNNCYVFFAVKKNVDEIKEFIEPKRQDDYGVSVISIQFSKGETNTLSIKNRYNHSVINSDATFSNNLDNIKKGLTKAFEKQYNLNINYNKYGFEIPKYVKANDGKYYKYNYEINNIYYCPDNIIIDNSDVKKYDKADHIVLDYFILNLRDKSIVIYDKSIDDDLTKHFDNIKKIEVKLDKQNKKKKIYLDDSIIIVLDDQNNIIKYKNSKIKKIYDNFMIHNTNLKVLDLPEVEEINNDFLINNKKITDVCLKNVEVVGNNFLTKAEKLSCVDMSKVKIIGDKFLNSDTEIDHINLPNVKIIGNCFMNCNRNIREINLSKVEIIGNNFLNANEKLLSIEFPNLRRIGNNFLMFNEILTKIYLPKVEKIGNNFLLCNKNFNSNTIDDNKFSLKNVKILENDSYFNIIDEKLERLKSR